MIKFSLKSIKQVIGVILVLILLLCPVFCMYTNAVKEPAGLHSAGAVLMDAESGRVLFSKNQDMLLAMASTTKIMTCILALELGQEDQVVTISEYAASMPDVQMNARAGEQYYLKDLLYSTMLESHNDSATAVAEAIGGSVEGFLKLMNQKAEAIGCENTHFVTPNGLDGEDSGGLHQTSAKELAMLMRYCIEVSDKSREFLEITGTRAYEFQELDKKRYVSCRNHNALLEQYEGAMTGKTGFTGKAGYCYVGAVRKDERTLIIALLGAGAYPNKSLKWKDAVKLLDYGFQNYDYKRVGKNQWKLPEVLVLEGVKNTAMITTNATEFLYILCENDNVQCKISYQKQLQAPVVKNSLIGTITYELDGMIIEQFQVLTAEDIEKETFWIKAKMFLEKVWDFVVKL